MNIRGWNIVNNARTIAGHVLTWIILIFLHQKFLSFNQFDSKINLFMLSWIFSAVIFYANYSLLIPALLFKQKNLYYTLSSVSVMIILHLIYNSILEEHLVYFQSAFTSNYPANNYTVALNPVMPVTGRLLTDILPNGLTLSFSRIALFYIAGFSIRLMQRLRVSEQRFKNSEAQKLNYETSFLNGQINAHFIFNSLNNLYSLSIRNKSENNLNESILRLSSILRYSLYETGNNLPNADDAIQIIDDYIHLQKLCFTKSVSVKYRVDGTPGDYTLDPQIILPIIENCFKHGIDPNPDSESRIEIELKINNEYLQLKTRNKITSRSGNEKYGGIGLRNTLRRLDLQYNGNYKFDTETDNENYSVLLEMGLKNEVYCN